MECFFSSFCTPRTLSHIPFTFTIFYSAGTSRREILNNTLHLFTYFTQRGSESTKMSPTFHVRIYLFALLLCAPVGSWTITRIFSKYFLYFLFFFQLPVTAAPGSAQIIEYDSDGSKKTTTALPSFLPRPAPHVKTVC